MKTHDPDNVLFRFRDRLRTAFEPVGPRNTQSTRRSRCDAGEPRQTGTMQANGDRNCGTSACPFDSLKALSLWWGARFACGLPPSVNFLRNDRHGRIQLFWGFRLGTRLTHSWSVFLHDADSRTSKRLGDVDGTVRAREHVEQCGARVDRRARVTA